MKRYNRVLLSFIILFVIKLLDRNRFNHTAVSRMFRAGFRKELLCGDYMVMMAETEEMM